ncbi:bestrophin family ion channel [Synechococcus sp. UW105]|uniref:bestrophin family ion channel n=2 Tax=unclassified Synechococcus TaxID=2626047 RepID=UPI001FCABD50|nr:bestrophin family ion channel [Synechococcus sp. UW105]
MANQPADTSRQSMRVDEGPYGDPPKTRRRDYSMVLAQLLWRMRFDLLLLLGFCGLVLSNLLPDEWFQSESFIRTLGIAVSIFIGFRNTQAINRWWEARKLWGSVVNHSRNWNDNLTSLLSRQQLRSQNGQKLLTLQVAMVWQLNFQLRNFWHRDLRHLQDGLLAKLRLPTTATLRELSETRAKAVQSLHQEGWIDGWGRQQLMTVANACTDAIGGLERIRNTPLPASYDVFVRLINWVFGWEVLVEFHRQGSGWPSILIGVAIFTCFLMAERIGAYVEGPFDADGSSFSLPLNTICLTISRDLLGDQFDHLIHHDCRDPVRWS